MGFNAEFDDFFRRLRKWCCAVKAHTDHRHPFHLQMEPNKNKQKTSPPETSNNEHREQQRTPTETSNRETNDVVSEFLCETIAVSGQSSGDVDGIFTQPTDYLAPFVSHSPVVCGEGSGFVNLRKENVLTVIQFLMLKFDGLTGGAPQGIFRSFVWKAANLVATSHSEQRNIWVREMCI